MPNNIVEQEVAIPDVQVVIGDIEGLQDPKIYDTTETQRGVWTDYYVEHRYEADGQIYMMPVTSPDGFQGDSVAFVKLAGGTMLWIADWTAEKVGEKPNIPDPELNNDNIVLLDKHFYMTMMDKFADGSVVYRESGTYVYGFKNPSEAVVHHPRPAWMSKEVDCSISASQFVGGIIECEGNETPVESTAPDNPEESGSF